jgi:hypothetical protein
MSVKIREKREKLYFDIYQGGKRTWEALHFSLTTDKTQNREIMHLADICWSKQETQVLAGSWDIQDPVAGRKKLVTYLEKLAKAKLHSDYITGCIRYLKKYTNGNTIQLSQITPQWIDGFQQYLLKETLSPTTAYDYSKAIHAATYSAGTGHTG